jgi:hypothetical protein
MNYTRQIFRITALFSLFAATLYLYNQNLKKSEGLTQLELSSEASSNQKQMPSAASISTNEPISNHDSGSSATRSTATDDRAALIERTARALKNLEKKKSQNPLVPNGNNLLALDFVLKESREWQLVKNLRALPPGKDQNDTHPLFYIDNFAIVESPDDATKLSDNAIVYDSRKERYGVVTGVIVVVVRDFSNLPKTNIPLQVEYSAPNLNTLFVRPVGSKAEGQLEKAYAEIKADTNNVTSVRLEIIFHNRQKL